MNKYMYLVKNTGFLALSSFSSRILVFLLVPFYTNVLSTSEYGIFDLASTTIQLLIPILTLNIYEGVTLFLMSKDSNQKIVVSTGIKFVVLGMIVFSALLFINKLFNFFSVFQGYELLIFLYFISYLCYQFLVQCAKGFEKVKYMGIAGVISTLVMVMTNILFLAIWNIGLTGFFLSYILGQGLAAAYLFLKLHIWKYCTIKIDLNLQKELVAYSIPLILNTIGWWINNVSDRYIVTWICGVPINGIYSVSYKIPSILSTFQAIFTQSWQISAIKEYGNEGYKKFYAKMLELINAIVCLMGIFLIILTKPIAHILYAKDFYVAWKYVPFLLVATVFSAAAGMVGPVLSAKKESKALGLSTIVGALTNVILNIILVHFIGAQGAAIATAISSFFIFGFRYLNAIKDFEGVNMIRILGVWGVMILQAVIMILIEAYILQVLLIVLVMLVYKNYFGQIKEMLKNRR